MKEISFLSKITRNVKEEQKEGVLQREVRDLEGLMMDAFNESENAMFSQRCGTEEMRHEGNSILKWQRSQLSNILPNET